MVESSGKFSALESELVALAEQHIAAFDSYTVAVEDPARGLFARYTVLEANRLTVSKYRAAGLTLEQIKAFYGNILENATKVNKTYQLSKVDEVEGYAIYHNLAKVPFPLTNRSTLFVEYIKEHEGTYYYMSSSKGCDELVTKHAKIIGKNVVGRGIIVYEKYTPYEGGYDICTVTCVDPAGSIPGFIKDYNAAKHAESPCTLANFMIHGKVAKD